MEDWNGQKHKNWTIKNIGDDNNFSCIDLGNCLDELR